MHDLTTLESFGIFSAGFGMLCIIIVILAILITVLVEKIQYRKSFEAYFLNQPKAWSERLCSSQEINSFTKVFKEGKITDLILLTEDPRKKWICGRINSFPFEFQEQSFQVFSEIQLFKIQVGYESYKVLKPSGSFLIELHKILEEVKRQVVLELKEESLESKLGINND